MVIASIRALQEADIKKIVALSTLSQLGVIVSRLRLNSPDLVIFHLLAHAFFKALLFVAAGFIIHNSSDYQDLRRIGRKTTDLLLTKRRVLLCKARLAGLPFFSAFFSKELILESMCAG